MSPSYSWHSSSPLVAESPRSSMPVATNPRRDGCECRCVCSALRQGHVQRANERCASSAPGVTASPHLGREMASRPRQRLASAWYACAVFSIACSYL